MRSLLTRSRPMRIAAAAPAAVELSDERPETDPAMGRHRHPVYDPLLLAGCGDCPGHQYLVHLRPNGRDVFFLIAVERNE